MNEMNIKDQWDRLDPATQKWLIDNPGCLILPRTMTAIKPQRAIVADEVEKLLDDFPLSQVLMSMPGVGVKTAATILLTIGDAGAFTTAGHLASYAAIAPVTRRSGTSIRFRQAAWAGFSS